MKTPALIQVEIEMKYFYGVVASLLFSVLQTYIFVHISTDTRNL